ncbi:unnamed protein product [Protopolystoma xenopodis]|uniref:Uncharacterized protein n=1 Tax=Protopolystoma xenopodis TaxID=117903 RepID=A0A448XS69_9PLAT|nr:unnamed protein product [Protopolystoma xenopodis]
MAKPSINQFADSSPLTGAQQLFTIPISDCNDSEESASHHNLIRMSESDIEGKQQQTAEFCTTSAEPQAIENSSMKVSDNTEVAESMIVMALSTCDTSAMMPAVPNLAGQSTVSELIQTSIQQSVVEEEEIGAKPSTTPLQVPSFHNETPHARQLTGT